MGIVLFLWSAAWWIWMGSERRLLRLTVATVLSTVLYLVHFCAWAAYGLFLLGFEMSALWRNWSLPRALALLGNSAQALPPALLLGYTAMQHHDQPALIHYDRLWSRLGDASLLIDTSHPWLDIVIILAYLALVAAAVQRDALRLVHRAIVPTILCVVLFFLIPDTFYNANYVAWRLLLPAVLATLCSLTPGEHYPRARKSIVGVVLAIVIFATGFEAVSAEASEREEAVFLKAIQPVPAGATLFWAHSGVDEHALIAHAVGTYHLGAFAVPEKRALIQSMFAYPGQQILHYRDSAFADTPRNSEVFLPDIQKAFVDAGKDLPSHVLEFEYVLLQGPGDAALEQRTLPMTAMRLIRTVGDCRLYRTARRQDQ
jgi:hypothetical protein